MFKYLFQLLIQFYNCRKLFNFYCWNNVFYPSIYYSYTCFYSQGIFIIIKQEFPENNKIAKQKTSVQTFTMVLVTSNLIITLPKKRKEIEEDSIGQGRRSVRYFWQRLFSLVIRFKVCLLHLLIILQLCSDKVPYFDIYSTYRWVFYGFSCHSQSSVVACIFKYVLRSRHTMNKSLFIYCSCSKCLIKIVL